MKIMFLSTNRQQINLFLFLGPKLARTDDSVYLLGVWTTAGISGENRSSLMAICSYNCLQGQK